MPGSFGLKQRSGDFEQSRECKWQASLRLQLNARGKERELAAASTERLRYATAIPRARVIRMS